MLHHPSPPLAGRKSVSSSPSDQPAKIARQDRASVVGDSGSGRGGGGGGGGEAQNSVARIDALRQLLVNMEAHAVPEEDLLSRLSCMLLFSVYII